MFRLDFKLALLVGKNIQVIIYNNTVVVACSHRSSLLFVVVERVESMIFWKNLLYINYYLQKLHHNYFIILGIFSSVKASCSTVYNIKHNKK